MTRAQVLAVLARPMGNGRYPTLSVQYSATMPNRATWCGLKSSGAGFTPVDVRTFEFLRDRQLIDQDFDGQWLLVRRPEQGEVDGRYPGRFFE